MRIISKFQDYYDSVQKMYQHDHIGPTSNIKSVTSDVRPWIRNIIEIDTNEINFKFNFPRIKISHTNFKKVNIKSFVIGFCGKIYPGICMSYLESNPNGEGYTETKEHCYNIADVDKVVKTFYSKNMISKKEFDFYYESKKKNLKSPYSFYWERYSDDKVIYFHRIHLEEKFNKIEEKRDGFDELFQLKNSPIFSIESRGEWPKRNEYLIFNCCLKDYQFYRVFDANSAYQEISMYLSNLCFPEPHINPVPDEINAESHGFNKFSFRKDPTKKK